MSSLPVLTHGALVYDETTGQGHMDERRLIKEIITPFGTVTEITVLAIHPLGLHCHDYTEKMILSGGQGRLITQPVNEDGELVGVRVETYIQAPYFMYIPIGLVHTFYLDSDSILYVMTEQRFNSDETHRISLL